MRKPPSPGTGSHRRPARRADAAPGSMSPPDSVHHKGLGATISAERTDHAVLRRGRVGRAPTTPAYTHRGRPSGPVARESVPTRFHAMPGAHFGHPGFRGSRAPLNTSRPSPWPLLDDRADSCFRRPVTASRSPRPCLTHKDDQGLACHLQQRLLADITPRSGRRCRTQPGPSAPPTPRQITSVERPLPPLRGGARRGGWGRGCVPWSVGGCDFLRPFAPALPTCGTTNDRVAGSSRIEPALPKFIMVPACGFRFIWIVWRHVLSFM